MPKELKNFLERPSKSSASFNIKEKDKHRSFLVQQFLDIEQEFVVMGVRTKDSARLVGVVDKHLYSKHFNGMALLFHLNDPPKVVHRSTSTVTKALYKCFQC